MKEVKTQRPILTDTYSTPDTFSPEANSIYVFGESEEFRCRHIEHWRDRATGVRLLQIIEEDGTTFSLKNSASKYFLRSSNSLLELWSSGEVTLNRIYIDITGLSHSVWAALLKSAINTGLSVLVVYVEPKTYVRSHAPVEGELYDLSDQIQGIAPLPSYTVLSNRLSKDFLFVPFLGFEGTRLRYLIEQIQPGQDQIVPVVGLPGFKPWYVFETYKGNKEPLQESDAWQLVRFAPADCPFSSFYLLQDIVSTVGNKGVKVAPIGTKPHALGVVMFAITKPNVVEIVYDHPIRKRGRSDGTSKLHVYHISTFIHEFM